MLFVSSHFPVAGLELNLILRSFKTNIDYFTLTYKIKYSVENIMKKKALYRDTGCFCGFPTYTWELLRFPGAYIRW